MLLEFLECKYLQKNTVDFYYVLKNMFQNFEIFSQGSWFILTTSARSATQPENPNFGKNRRCTQPKTATEGIAEELCHSIKTRGLTPQQDLGISK